MSQVLTRILSFLTRPGLALFGCFFFLSLALTSRERPWGDATPMYEVAESLVGHLAIDIKTRWPAGQPPGRDGKFYDVHPIGAALAHVPGVLIQKGVGRFWKEGRDTLRTLCCHLGPAALGALTCVLFWGIVRRRLGVAARPALLSAVGLASATCVWVYARYPYSEMLQIACFTALLAGLLRARDEGSVSGGVLAGVAGGLLLNSKIVYAVSLPGAAVVLLVALRHDRRALARVVAGGVAGLAPFVALALWYNHARWTSTAATGYAIAPATFHGNVLVGLLGMFLSPGKSIFLYCPLLVLALFGLPKLVRRHPFTFAAIVATVIPPLLVSAALICWSGDYAWGPRYLVYAVPALALPAALFIERAFGAAHRLERWARASAIAAVLVAGVAVNLLGSALYWDHFLRMAREVTPQWLGAPVKLCPAPGVPTLVPGNCESCFEDMYGVMWLPPFQPIRGHYWFAKHLLADHTWVQAVEDAPWRSYTALPVNVSFSYGRGRIDWWWYEWKVVPHARWLLAAFITGAVAWTALLGLAFRRLPRTPRASAPDALADPVERHAHAQVD